MIITIIGLIVLGIGLIWLTIVMDKIEQKRLDRLLAPVYKEFGMEAKDEILE